MKIIYEDNHILVAYKDKGILSQADGSSRQDMLSILKQYIKEKYNKPGNVYLGLVHRLDINTSGIMVFAKTSKAASRLFDSITKHQFEKRYIATVEGKLENSEFIELKSKLKKDEAQKKSFPSLDGKEAILLYRMIQNHKIDLVEVTDIEVILKTGRFHQIRAQFSEIGHPLYGDVKYGSKHKISEEKFPLCAYYLSFPHPITKEILKFEEHE